MYRHGTCEKRANGSCCMPCRGSKEKIDSTSVVAGVVLLLLLEFLYLFGRALFRIGWPLRTHASRVIVESLSPPLRSDRGLSSSRGELVASLSEFFSSYCGRACRLFIVGSRWTSHAIREIDIDPVSQHPYPADCCGADELSSYDLGARRAEEHSKSR